MIVPRDCKRLRPSPQYDHAMAVELRKAEAWETSAPAPFLTIDPVHGAVAVQSLGQERFRASTPREERAIAVFAAGRAATHRLAGGLEGGGAWRTRSD